ncbi:hypoxanthine phosphoribosyltransferase [Nanoarchaeota archaeon]
MENQFRFADITDITEDSLPEIPWNKYGDMFGNHKKERFLGTLVSVGDKRSCVSRMAKRITADYRQILNPGEAIVAVPLLNGAKYFATDLTSQLYLPMELDTLKVESYGSAKDSSGEIKLHKDLSRSVKDRHVLIIEDIVDTGWTLDFVVNGLLKHKRPKSIRIATFLDKHCKRQADITPDYAGFRISDLFVIGYGLDLNHQLRNLPFVAVYR